MEASARYSVCAMGNHSALGGAGMPLAKENLRVVINVVRGFWWAASSLQASGLSGNAERSGKRCEYGVSDMKSLVKGMAAPLLRKKSPKRLCVYVPGSHQCGS